MDNGKYQLALDKSAEVFVDDLCDGTLLGSDHPLGCVHDHRLIMLEDESECVLVSLFRFADYRIWNILIFRVPSPPSWPAAV